MHAEGARLYAEAEPFLQAALGKSDQELLSWYSSIREGPTTTPRRGTILDAAQALGEAEIHGGESLLLSGQHHKKAHQVVRGQTRPQFLLHHLHRLGGQFFHIHDGFHITQIQFNGLITNDKFGLTWKGEVQLSWWRRPLRLRR